MRALFFLLALAWSFPADAQMLLLGVDASKGAGGSFTGAADIVASPTGCWSLRACGNSFAGGNVVDLSNGTTTCIGVKTFSSGVNKGNLDTTVATPCNGSTQTVTAWCGASCTSGGTFKITKWYDQAGGGDWTQATAANQPSFVLSCLNSQPCAHFTLASTQTMTNILTSPLNGYPFTQSIVFRPSTTTTGANNYNIAWVYHGTSLNDNIGLDIDGPTGKFTINVSNGAGTFASLGIGSALTANVFHTGLFSGSSSTSRTGYLDGGSAATDVTSSSFGGAQNSSGVGAYVPQCCGGPYDGDLFEFVAWTSALSAGNATSLNTNQAAFW